MAKLPGTAEDPVVEDDDKKDDDDTVIDLNKVEDEKKDPEKGDKETIVCAEINMRDIIVTKHFVDSAGHFSRPEVLSLVVNQTAYTSARFVGDQAAAGMPPSGVESQRREEASSVTETPSATPALEGASE